MKKNNVTQAVIFAGGKGTRFAEQTVLRPKPMIEVDGKPILWHIMKIYYAYGINEFLICLGYKGHMIKEYFIDYASHRSDITVDVRNDYTSRVTVHRNHAEEWKITLIDTGEDTMTGGRLKRMKRYIKTDRPFCLTYGDGVSDINIKDTINFHNKHGKLATISGVRPPARFGALDLDGTTVKSFKEKPIEEGGFINGGFFVLDPKVIDYIDNDSTIWEQEPLIRLSQEGQLKAYLHEGFWQPMDAQRDKNHLEELVEQGNAPWKIW